MITNSTLLAQKNHYIPIKTTYEEVRSLLPDLTVEKFKNLVFTRGSSDADSNMTTLGLHTVLVKDQIFKITSSGLLSVSPQDCSSIRHLLQQKKQSQILPLNTPILKGTWNCEETDHKNNGNILGGYGRFTAESSNKEFHIPLKDISLDQETAEQALAFYGAELIQEGECIRFYDDRPFPIWEMQIAEHYVEEWLYRDQAGGEYIEWHRDRPHWHHALNNTNGFYIFGKKTREDYSEMMLTGFKIPKGYAVYTYNGVIHSDAHLTGHWLVGYDESNDYSTVKTKNSENQDLHILPQ